MTVTGVRHAYQRYNKRYWNGELPQCSIKFATLKKYQGLTKGFREIIIDPTWHFDDRGIRHTLLHEMVHVAAMDQPVHGLEFWREVEYILRKGAPIDLLAGYERRFRRILQGFSSPLDFYFCKKALKKLEAREKRLLQWEKRFGQETPSS